MFPLRSKPLKYPYSQLMKVPRKLLLLWGDEKTYSSPQPGGFSTTTIASERRNRSQKFCAILTLQRIQPQNQSNMSQFRSLTFLLIWGAAWASASAAPHSNDEAERLYYAGLRERGLFALIESDLQTQLSQESRTPNRRAYLMLELSRTYAAHAAQRLGDEQQELWKLAQSTADRGFEDGTQTEWSAHLRLQKAIVPLEQSRFELWQLRLTPHDEALRRTLSSQFSSHLKQLRATEIELNRESKQVLPRYRTDPGAISPFEFRAVQKQNIFLIAQTLADLAEADSSEPQARTPPIRAALDRLRVLLGGVEDERITWEAKLLEARCNRLQGEYGASRTNLQRSEEGWPASLQADRLAEEIRLLLATDQRHIAAGKLIEWRDNTGSLTGELSLLKLQTLSAMWKFAWNNQQKSQADDLLVQIQRESDRAQREVGGIWAWRCQVFLSLMEQSTKYGPEVAEKVRTAQAAYQASDFERAAGLYREIATAAAQQKRADLASEMLFTAGSVWLQAGDFSAAKQVFRGSADTFPDTLRAADCHLMWVWCLGKEYERAPTRSNREAYTAGLDEHLQQYGSSSTAGDARLMYGQFQENRLQFTKALDDYLAVPTEHAKASIADLAALRCSEKIQLRYLELNLSQQDWRKEVSERMQPRIAAYPQDASKLSLIQCQVLNGAAKLMLGVPELDRNVIDRNLERVLSAAESRTTESPQADEWKAIALSAYRLRIVLLAQQGKVREAEALISRVAKAGTDPLLELLDGLTSASDQVDASTRRDIGQIQLQTSLALNQKRDRLSPAERLKLDRCLAKSYLLTARSREAHDLYETLLEQQPNDRELRLEYAKSLTHCGTPECLRRALPHWQYLENRAKQGTPDWLRMRLEVIRSLLATDRVSEAEKLLSVTELLYPDLGGESLKQEYAGLKQKIGRKN